MSLTTSLTEFHVLRNSKRTLEEVKSIDVWSSKINEVSLLRRMPALEVISLSENAIDDRILEHVCAGCPNLRELYMRKNKLTNIEAMGFLRLLPITHLWFDDNVSLRLEGGNSL